MTTLPPLAESQDVADRIGRDLTDAEEAQVDTLLASASAAVRSFCRRDFTTVTDDVIRIKPVGDKVTLPQRPVTSISMVKRINYDGSATAFAGWLWDGGYTVYGLSCIGSIMINAPEFWYDEPYTPFVEVTYSHGEADVPDVILDIVCGMVIRVFTAPGAGVEGVTGQTLGPFSYTSQVPLPGRTAQLSDTDKQRLRDAGYTRSGTTVALR